MSIALGALLGLVIVWMLLRPLEKKSSDSEPRGIILPAELAGDSGLDLEEATDLLIKAIVQIESHGDPRQVGGMGERGLMQIREGTWKEVTREHFGGEISFDRAFEPELNQQVGRTYLGELQRFLYQNRRFWKSDLRSLLLASYNAGPERVRQSGFDLNRLPENVQSYARRGSSLHDWYLEEQAATLHRLLDQAGTPPPLSSE
ncbi:MAG: lytic transglycosylase domain-containing protein [Kiritimatiellia bacterium]